LMTPRVLKVLCIFHLDSVFHMGQDCAKDYPMPELKLYKYTQEKAA
jgi:hypothetical protein